jgi:hypothetical protein
MSVSARKSLLPQASSPQIAPRHTAATASACSEGRGVIEAYIADAFARRMLWRRENDRRAVLYRAANPGRSNYLIIRAGHPTQPLSTFEALETRQAERERKLLTLWTERLPLATFEEVREIAKWFSYKDYFRPKMWGCTSPADFCGWDCNNPACLKRMEEWHAKFTLFADLNRRHIGANTGEGRKRFERIAERSCAESKPRELSTGGRFAAVKKGWGAETVWRWI